VARKLEFWPDYSGALLWDEEGKQVALESVPVTVPLREDAAVWLSEYDDSKLPWEPTADQEWLARGRMLLNDLRLALGPHGIEVNPDEDYWEP
jgi:hypothetical protein